MQRDRCNVITSRRRTGVWSLINTEGKQEMVDEAKNVEKTIVINVPEAVGVFDSFEAQQAAFYDLRAVGFHHSDISLLGSKEALEEKLGKAYWRASDLEDDPRAPRAHFVSEEAIGELEGAISGGFFFVGSYIAMAAMLTPVSTLAASIAAIAIGGGPAAVLGALLARRVGKHHKEYYADQIRHGGILMWVRCRDKDREELAVQILKGHSGRDVHVHGWSE
jgi:VIT1/CCC1 family predicted Fe2+/Mn2+ transporter